MTREEAAKLWPIVKAFGEGKRVEILNSDSEWIEEMCGIFLNLAPNRYRIAPDVGSAEWANALPVGSRVRWKGWRKYQHNVRQEEGWYYYDEDGPCMGKIHGPLLGDRWELYTPPARKFRPWKPEEVPVGAQIRFKDSPADVALITRRTTIDVFYINGEFATNTTKAFETHEHSLDHGKTWNICGVEEVES